MLVIGLVTGVSADDNRNGQAVKDGSKNEVTRDEGLQWTHRHVINKSKGMGGWLATESILGRDWIVTEKYKQGDMFVLSHKLSWLVQSVLVAVQISVDEETLPTSV